MVRSPRRSIFQQMSGKDVQSRAKQEKEVCMAKGTVKWFNKDKGFGFILPDEGGRDVYVHVNNLDAADHVLADGQRVEYEMGMGRKGPEAIKVKPI